MILYLNLFYSLVRLSRNLKNYGYLISNRFIIFFILLLIVFVASVCHAFLNFLEVIIFRK